MSVLKKIAVLFSILSFIILVAFLVYFFVSWFYKGVSVINLNPDLKIQTNKTILKNISGSYSSNKGTFIIFPFWNKATVYGTGIDINRDPIFYSEAQKLGSLNLLFIFYNKNEKGQGSLQQKAKILSTFVVSQLVKIYNLSSEETYAVVYQNDADSLIRLIQ